MAYITFSPSEKSAGVTLSGGNLTASTSSSGVQCVKGTEYRTTGKWYCEFTATTQAGAVQFGLANVAEVVTNQIGQTANSYSYTTSGNKYHTSSVAYGAAISDGDVVSMLFDADAQTLSFWKNGADQGVAYTGVDISTGWTIGYSTYIRTTATTVNTGATAFAYTPPAGYVGWGPVPGSVGVGAGTTAALTAYGARIAAGAGTVPALQGGGGRNGFGVGTTPALTAAGTGGSNFGALTLPLLTASATGSQVAFGAGTTTALIATGTGYESSINSAALVAPAPTLSATAPTGSAISFAGVAPKPQVLFGFKDARLTAPKPTLSATLVTGTSGAAALTAPTPTLVAVMDNPAIITVSGSARPPILVATLVTGSIITGSFTAPAPRLAATGLTGNAATFAGSAVAPILAAAGYPAYTITFAGSAPVPYLSAAMGAPVTEAYRTWVLNTRKASLTEYDNFSFNSYAVFQGVVLGCGSSGIVALGTQDLDNATAITARARTGKNSFGSSFLKRVPRLYASLETDGDIIMRTITNEGGTRSYLLGWNHGTGLQQRRVPVGKGPKSVFWSFEIENVAGSDFGLNALLTYPVTLKRRVQ